MSSNFGLVTDRRTESDAYERTVQVAQVGSKMMDDLARKLFPKEVCAMLEPQLEVLLSKLRLKMLANITLNWTTRRGDGKIGA